MFKKRTFNVLTAICLAFACVVSSLYIVDQKVAADDVLSDVYDSSNYENPYEKDRVIVAFKQGVDYQVAVADQGLTYNSTLSTEDSTYDLVLFETKEKSAQGVIDTIEELKKNPAVAYAEPDYILTATDTVPNDPKYSSLYGMKKISAPKTWDIHRGTKNRNVVVGIIDSGVDYTHPDLAANIWVNPREIANNGKDDDGNGYVDDVYGWNFVSNNNKPLDDNGHGSHVAGTIGGVGNNRVGVVGVAWTTQIAALKFLDANGRGSTSNAIKAINYAKEMHFAITNNSWGGGSFSQSLKSAIDSYPGLFVAAAGNNGSNNDSKPHYPSNYISRNIISVAATTSSDAKASFSNYGRSSVDLAAPGDKIYSTYKNGGYATLSGTSMAAPHVAGAAALLLSYKYSLSTSKLLSTSQLKAAVLLNVDKVSSMKGKCLTDGRLNVYKSIKYLETYLED